jgi:hypothetical protein
VGLNPIKGTKRKEVSNVTGDTAPYRVEGGGKKYKNNDEINTEMVNVCNVLNISLVIRYKEKGNVVGLLLPEYNTVIIHDESVPRTSTNKYILTDPSLSVIMNIVNILHEINILEST